MNRSSDWWRQAEADLAHARHAAGDEDYEWPAFAAQQAAEKALKALILVLGGEAWGHSLLHLCRRLSQRVTVAAEVLEAARWLDPH
ncbi:MAG: HEPN domain-containing protein [Thermoanaerobaculum sp.]